MVICMVKCMVHQPHQGGNYQVNSEFMGICFFCRSSYHHGNTLVLPWYFHHGKNHRNTRSTFLIFFLKIISSDLSRILLKDTFTVVLPWYYRGITMVLPGFTMVLPWYYRVLPWYDCGDAMVLKCYDITYKLYTKWKYHDSTTVIPW